MIRFLGSPPPSSLPQRPGLLLSLLLDIDSWIFACRRLFGRFFQPAVDSSLASSSPASGCALLFGGLTSYSHVRGSIARTPFKLPAPGLPLAPVPLVVSILACSVFFSTAHNFQRDMLPLKATIFFLFSLLKLHSACRFLRTHYGANAVPSHERIHPPPPPSV